MAFGHGKDAVVYGGGTGQGVDLTSYVRQVAASAAAATADVTTLADDWETFLAGLKSGGLTFEGFHDPATGRIHDVAKGLFGGEIVACYLPQGDARGSAGYSVKGILVAVDQASETTDASTQTGEIQSNVGLDALVSLLALTAKTSTFTETGSDAGASSANGGAGYIVCTATSGTPTLDAKIQHSTDGSVWADLVTFTQITTRNAQAISVTGTVNRHLRVIGTVGGGSPSLTIFAGFARR